MDYEKMSDAALVTELAKVKDKIKEQKAKENAIGAELQKRAVDEMDKRGIKFKRFKSSKGAVTVGNRFSLSLVSPYALKRLIGTELFESEVAETKEVNYKLSSSFENALKAIFLRDYDFSLAMEDVYNALGADEKQKKVLDKKLRGEYAKDYETLIAVLGKGAYDTEVFLINKIKNAELIKVFFPEKSAEDLEEIRKYLLVTETLSLTMVK